MNSSEEINRIQKEYDRRACEIPADYYSLEKPWNLYRYQSFCRELRKLLNRYGCDPLKDKKILEVGCGSGDWLLDFEKWGAVQKNISGIDLDEKRLSKARNHLPQADLRGGDAGCLPWADQSFDIVFQFTVFSSVLDRDLKKKMADEMRRVLKPDGVIIWYDLTVNNPRNSHVRGMNQKEIKKLFPSVEFDFKRITLAPPITRFLVLVSGKCCEFLERSVFLNTHYLGVIRKIRP